MPHRDSVDKIVTTYFAAVTKQPFVYKGATYSPKPIRVSPLIFRDYTCPEKCGGCCPRFTLDYLPNESAPYRLTERLIELNGQEIPIRTDCQSDSTEYHCRNLDRTSGRCLIHGRHPFTCDFELLRFVFRQEKVHFNQKLFGRGWAMLRVDGDRGARCSMIPQSDQTIGQILRKLKRLQQWGDHFHLETWTPEIIKWISDGPHTEYLDLPSRRNRDWE